MAIPMDLYALVGAPQLAALLVLLQRGAEELYSARNTQRLRAAGAREAGDAYYPVVAATHLAWIASLFFLVPPQAPIIWPLVAYYLALQVARYWVIASLGRYWTRRISGPARSVSLHLSSQLRRYDCRDIRAAVGLWGVGACGYHDRALVDHAPHQDQAGE